MDARGIFKPTREPSNGMNPIRRWIPIGRKEAGHDRRSEIHTLHMMREITRPTAVDCKAMKAVMREISAYRMLTTEKQPAASNNTPIGGGGPSDSALSEANDSYNR